jgi:hypothetical protein
MDRVRPEETLDITCFISGEQKKEEKQKDKPSVDYSESNAVSVW